jgi:hypothetical protein
MNLEMHTVELFLDLVTDEYQVAAWILRRTLRVAAFEWATILVPGLQSKY